MRAIREGRRSITEQARAEGTRAAELLRSVVVRSGLSVREVESRLGWGQGTLTKALNGVTPLRFSDAAAVSEAVGFPLGEFYVMLAQGSEEEGAPREGPKQEKEEPKISPEIRKAIRDEIQAAIRGLVKPPKPRKEKP